MQEKHLAKVYAWFMRQLESVGMQTGMEKTEAEIFLNPAKIDQIHEEREAAKLEKRIQLLDEEANEEKEKKRFEYRQRSIHTEIPPAKLRLEDYKRKDLSEKFHEKANET